ncbi:hypothetical protein A5893_10385 [Pedobacter psychrophilus]|uniref:Carbohydrate-binding protein SusD n=1 Tax=Pedobacter psychrophilus TaxID=1826909 RepID=A0A179DFN7_9SPHI|nr:hypothetical protein A5893_10385 [Pedobacter psychrophilus]
MAFTIALFLGVSSCKNFTDITPDNTLAENDAYSNDQRALAAITGVYSAAQSSPYTDGSNRGYPFGAANTIQGDMRGEDLIAVPSFFAITNENTHDVTTANNTAMWTSLFATINRANEVIEKLVAASAAGTVTQAVSLKGQAEARFLRALSYHELLVLFARPYNHTVGATHLGVPIREVANNTPQRVEENRNAPRNTVAQCYSFILADLDFAETNLTATNGSTSLTITRATKGAAVALKTRIKLHMGDYAGVITEGTKLGTSAASGPYASATPYAVYRLTASPDGPFSSTAANYGNTESIFSIEHSTIRNAGTNGSLSTMLSRAPGRALIAISPIIWNQPFWRADDLRRTLLTGTDVPPAVSRSYFSLKYKDVPTFTDANPIIRYAEVLLNVAEAYSRITALDVRALNLLNAVRNRSVTLAANQFTIASFATGITLTQAILNERRIEFLGEGRRYPDIHRLALDPNFGTNGIPSKVTYAAATFASYNTSTPYAGARAIAAIPYDINATNGFKFIWPIPQVETNTNPVLAAQQNPGY